MKDLYTLLEEATEDMAFTAAEDNTTTDLSFEDILAMAEEKHKELFVDDETPSY